MKQQEQQVLVNAERLQEWIQEMLVRVGVPKADAQIAALVLTDADLTGRHTHGVNRLPLYIHRIQEGLIDPNPQLRWSANSVPTMGVLNGGNGLGPVVAWRATERAIDMAKEHGSAFVGVNNSNHCGAMSVYCTHAAQQGLIMMALTNSPPGIPPWGGRKAYLGTNPIAWGIPRGSDKAPLIVDMATSIVARGNIIEANRVGQPIPMGWAIDASGHPTTNAQEALQGAILPMAGPKGYALALIVEILSGVLTGAGFGPGVQNPYADSSGPSNVGHFFCLIRPGWCHLERL